MTVPKEYIPHEIEKKWKETWDMSMYHFDWKDNKKPQFIIDTPPPYPTGNFHIGNSLNWCYIDFIARYKRMCGYNVMFPQGWDCHGLPTEVKVEEIHGITKNKVPREEFRQMCRELTTANIEKMRNTMMNLGFSIDWSNEFVTMEPSYFVKTQRSFKKMYDMGQIYQAEHPVNWCPRCETAIAFAEVEYEGRDTKLNFLNFDTLKIATTRPELLAACVAVAINPNDKRYNKYIGTNVKVPLFEHDVTVIGDTDVDPSFGTGVVMICTFGDKQDVRWWVEHKLPLRKAIDKNGIMTSIAGKYAGMTINQCKETVISDLKTHGYLYDQKNLDQNVGMCWRCNTPIEILSERQWFVKIDTNSVKSAADNIFWVPEYMKIRLDNWIQTMEWDWCISRQRIFATPIPAWYCKDCGELIVAKEEWMPVDPTQNTPKDPCSKCGGNHFEAEEDVLDTWMDSSITVQHVTGWLSDNTTRLPAQLRPQGHDIIRTWAFYSILRSMALTSKHPWDTILINGMVLGEDGHKMSKSLGNIISPEEVIEKYSADSFRQWAAIGGSTGSDVMFRWKDVVSASRFFTKMWSVYRFSLSHLGDFDKSNQLPKVQLHTIDKWLLDKLYTLINKVTIDMDTYQFDEAFKSIRTFVWDIVADNYIELVKSRLYNNDQISRKAAQYTLYLIMDNISKLLAPFAPFFAEEMYSRLGKISVHMQNWPTALNIWKDESSANEGELIKNIVSSVRRYKSEHGIALNSPLQKLEIYTDLDDITDIIGATNTPVELISGTPEFDFVPTKIKPNMGVIGPKFKKDAKEIILSLSHIDPQTIIDDIDKKNKIDLVISKGNIELTSDSIEIEKEIISLGRAVDVLDVQGVQVIIIK